MQDRVICIIPARGGSKGLKHKNTLSINGESLIGRSIRHAQESECIDDIFVSTDDREIASLAISAGAKVPFLRNSCYAQDLTTTEQTLQNALLEYEKFSNTTYDICVYLSACEIFRDPCWVRECVERLKSNSELESVFVGYRTTKNFWEKNDSGSWQRLKKWMSIYSSRQIRQHIVREDTGLACASRADLWRNGRRIGDSIDIIEVNDQFTFIDVHTLEDLKLANAAVSIRMGR